MLSFTNCDKLSPVLGNSFWNGYKYFKILQINIYKGKNIFILSRAKANYRFIYQDVRFHYNKSYNVGKYGGGNFVVFNNIKF